MQQASRFEIFKAFSRKDDGLLGKTQLLEGDLESIDHRRRATEKDACVRTGRGAMSSQDIAGYAPDPATPSSWGLFQDMMAMEVLVFSQGPVPLGSQDDVLFGLVGKNQEEFRIDLPDKNPTDDGNHWGDASASSHEADPVCHSIHPVATCVRSTHEDRITDLPIVEVFRDSTGFVPFNSQIEMTSGVGCR